MTINKLVFLNSKVYNSFTPMMDKRFQPSFLSGMICKINNSYHNNSQVSPSFFLSSSSSQIAHPAPPRASRAPRLLITPDTTI